MSRDERGRRGQARPLDAEALDRLAIAYVGRYATTRAKLARYLHRKVKERGWAADPLPPVEAIVARCARLGYVNDADFAAQRGAALARAGVGARRVAQALDGSGVSRADAEPVVARARDQALEAALAFARRRRIGPFAREERDEDQRRRDLAALVRAGHAISLARRISQARIDDEIE